MNSSLTNSVHQVVKTYYQTLYDYQFHLSIFWLHFYTRHSCEQRNWACPAVQNKQENRLGSIYAAVISQTVFISAEKTRLYRLKVPGLCTVVWHSLSFSTNEDLHFMIPTKKKKYIYIYIF